MSVPLTEEELLGELYFHPKPLSNVQDLEHEWLLGTWTLSKSHRTWRVGYGHPLMEGARLVTQPFDVDGKNGIAVVFESNGEPPWQMIGWVPTERVSQANDWVTFLNSEIDRRLKSEPAGANWTHREDGKDAMDYEDQLAEQKFKDSLLIKPFKSKLP